VAVPATSSGSDSHKKLSSLGTRSSAVWHLGVGRYVAGVSNDCSGVSRSTLNMVAVGSFETSAATPPPTQHLRRQSRTQLYSSGWTGFSFISQSVCLSLAGKCCLAEQCAGFVATVCPSPTRTRRLQQNCGAVQQAAY
jgi:hypothetical protein